ncbi:unnamed protein product [Amoebophrya sp. A120]|nr:unnamed protein product [Amoebophrya sp. A120]|eukprot:GSA120T00017753001.1
MVKVMTMTSSADEKCCDHLSTLQRLLAKQAARGQGTNERGATTSATCCSHALSLPNAEILKKVQNLLSTTYWSDAGGRPLLPQAYHLDCGPRQNGVDTDNVRTWIKVVEGIREAGMVETEVEEILVIRAPSASSSGIKVLSLEEEQSDHEMPSNRRLLRLTNAGAAAVLEQSSGVKSALERCLLNTRSEVLSEASRYIRLVKLQWPTSTRAKRKNGDESSQAGAVKISEETDAGGADQELHLRRFLEALDKPNGTGDECCERVIKPFTFCELFAGLGGFRIGLEALGGKCVFASEINPVCQAVYAGRWNERKPGDEEEAKSVASRGNDNTIKSTMGSAASNTKPPNNNNYVPGPAAAKADSIPVLGPALLHGDITKVPCSAIPSHDLLVGGFPCQPFSRLGNQDAFDEKRGRGVLYLEILRILQEKKPKMFLLENVPGIADGKEDTEVEFCENISTDVAAVEQELPAKRAKKDAMAFGDQDKTTSSSNKVQSSCSQQKSSPLDIILSDLKLGGLYNVQAKIYSSAPLTVQQRKRVYFVGVLREEGKKKRKIRFPEEILPDLGLIAEDAIEFEEPSPAVRTAGDAETTGGGGKGFGKQSGKTPTNHDPGRSLRLSPSQFEKLWHKLPSLQRQGKNLFLYPTTKKLGPVVSHYGHSPGHGNCQLVARPCDSVEGGVPRLLSAAECLRVMGINPKDFLPKMETDWVPGAVKFPSSKPLIKKSCYHIIGNAVCPPIIAWLAEKVVLPAGGFVEKRAKASTSEACTEVDGTKKGSALPVYLRLALEAVKDVTNVTRE